MVLAPFLAKRHRVLDLLGVSREGLESELRAHKEFGGPAPQLEWRKLAGGLVGSHVTHLGRSHRPINPRLTAHTED